MQVAARIILTEDISNSCISVIIEKLSMYIHAWKQKSLKKKKLVVTVYGEKVIFIFSLFLYFTVVFL